MKIPNAYEVTDIKTDFQALTSSISNTFSEVSQSVKILQQVQEQVVFTYAPFLSIILLYLFR